ncbi:hypothetical protein [Pseudogemmobacter sonorensis]|uniref:hypothetical protein n=1 Tax=Pseudogemmobacter sonorensis TaxID=2989681 RepID=UPI0036A9431E
MEHTRFGFAARIAGGNLRAARGQGLAVRRLALLCCAIAGACAGLFEVAAGYGFTGILVAFLARQNTLAVVPVAILFGALAASGGLVRRRMGLPDATLRGFIFVILLVSETFYGRFTGMRLPFTRPAPPQPEDRT